MIEKKKKKKKKKKFFFFFFFFFFFLKAIKFPESAAFCRVGRVTGNNNKFLLGPIIAMRLKLQSIHMPQEGLQIFDKIIFLFSKNFAKIVIDFFLFFKCNVTY